MKGQGCRGRYTPPPFLSRRASRHMLIPSQESVICSVASSYLHTRVVLFPDWENMWVPVNGLVWYLQKRKQAPGNWD